MRILVYGALGNIGRRIVAEAYERGHQVTAALRNPDHASRVPQGVTGRTGDAMDAENASTLASGQDLVISATRPSTGNERDLVKTAAALLEGLRPTDTRLLVVGGAASLLAPDTGRTIVDDPRYVSPFWREIALACCDQYAVLKDDLETDWTYLSPPAQLLEGERTGHYRVGNDTLLLDADGRSTISMEDLAVALLDEAETPMRRQTRFTVAY